MKWPRRLAMLLLIWAAVASWMALEPIQTPVGYSHPPECLCVDCEAVYAVQWWIDHQKGEGR
jgi:hypothetical protein